LHVQFLEGLTLIRTLEELEPAENQP
jgi:hypothetical protein